MHFLLIWIFSTRLDLLVEIGLIILISLPFLYYYYYLFIQKRDIYITENGIVIVTQFFSKKKIALSRTWSDMEFARYRRKNDNQLMLSLGTLGSGPDGFGINVGIYISKVYTHQVVYNITGKKDQIDFIEHKLKDISRKV
jgi:hypothetical protein